MSLAKCLKKLKIDSSHEDSIISGLASLTEQGNLEGYRKATLALDQAMNDTLDEQEDIHIQLEKQGYSFKEDNSVKDSKLLEEKLNKQGYTFTITPKNVRDFVAKDKTREAQATTATNLASKFGKRITWIDAKGDFGINGVVVPNIKDVIFLDVNTKYPAHAVMGHELSHHLEYDKPDVYKDLVASMEGLLKNHKEYADKYKIEGASHKDIVKEMIGDIMGDNFTKQDFWNKLADQDRSLFTKIADTIKAWLEQFIKSDNLGSDAFVKDVKKAREVIALAVAKYKDVQQPTQSAEAKFHKAFHGSSHDHDKFDSSKIGTGEGAQAYGYGHYFAESKDVAEYYKDNLSRLDYNPDSIPMAGGKTLIDMDNDLSNQVRGVKDPTSIYEKKEMLEQVMLRVLPDAVISQAREEGASESSISWFKSNVAKYIKDKVGRVYEVELAPEQEDYLLWDKPLSEQSDKVKRLLQNELRKHITIRSTQNNFTDVMYDGEELGSFKDHKVPNVVQNVVNHIPFSGEDLYKGYTEKQGSDKKASDYLHSLGIRGIKYLDGSSRDKGEGAYNYVIFDDNDVSITAKFSRTPKSLDAVEKSWDSKGIASSMSERNGIITLNKIVVPKDSRNAGMGTAAMRELTNYADTTNQQIALTPSADFGGNKVKLQAFYKRLGFRKNNEFNVMESMIRDPESAKFSRTIPYTAKEPIASNVSLEDLKAHPKYQEAKHGNLDSAISLVNDLISKEDVIKASNAFGKDVIYVPVTQFEKDGINRIPYAIAQKYASETGASINDSLYVKDKAFHTGMKMMERLIARTRFEGDIPKGKYVLVDDVTSSGATLADLSSYIQEQGGDVIGSVLLTNAMRGDKLIADKSLTKLLETKYGNEIRELFGIEPSSLTREEAKYLQGFRTPDELRASANKASSSRAERIRIKALPKSEDAKFSKVATENTLIAQHNLTVKNLLHSDRMGGLAAPSIAITDKTSPLKGFGEITLLADKDLVDPQDTIKINGVDRPTTNSEGKAIHPTQEGIINFWKWFGDSKVVDEQGRPEVVYHGTSQDISVFNTDGGKGKTYGTGSFFSSNPDTSATYTGGSNNGNMIPVYLHMEKPTVLDAQGSNWNRLNKNTRVILPKVTVSAQVDEDMLAALEDRTPEEGATYKLKARNTTLGKLLPDDFRYIDDYGSTDDIARWARQKGYAGLIINNVVDQGATGNFANERSSTPSTIYVVYNANQIKSAIGNNGEYSSANNDIRFSKEAIPEETTYQKSQRTVQDKFNRFSVIRDWLKERGVKLTELSNVYDAEERYHAKVANQLEDFREKVRNPLVEKIAKAGFTLSDVQDFLLAQHASEANKQIQKVRNDSEALAYGVTDEEASEYLSKAKPELAALANELRDVTEQAKQLRLDAGILNKDITDNWDNTYKHYVPVKGDESIQGTGKGLNVKHRDKRRLGHEKRNEAVIENILMDYERAVMEVEKNRVGKYLVMFAAEANNPDLITVGQPEKRNILKENNSYAIVDSDGVIHSVYVNKVDAQRNAPTGSSIQKISDPRVIAQASPMLAPNEVNVYMDGHAIRVQLNDDLLARAYANMGVESVGAIVEAGRVLNSYLSKVYTGYNPEFIVTNIIRDFTSGIVNLTGEEGTLMAIKAIGNYPKMFADLFRYAVTRKSTELIDSYRANGGNTGAAYLSDMERLGKEISSEYASYQGVIANIKAGDGANAFRAAGRKVFNSTLKWIEHLNQAGENAMRLSAYKAMLDSGKTTEQASKVAKNITVNFNRRGEIGQTANALYLFFNASVQGSAAVLHANLSGKHKYQANALAVGMASLGYMLAAGLGGMDEEEYDKIDDTTKERNLIIGSEGSYVKIPIPYGYGFFFNTGRVIADAQRKGEFGKAPFRMAVNAVEELTPFGNLVNSDEINSEQVVGGVAPTALQIPYQMSTNTSLFTGKEIRPVSPFKRNQPEREQMFRNTKGTVYDDMAGLLSNAGFDVSPENIKFLTRTLTGGAGALVDTAVSSSKLKAQGVELDIKEMPFIRKFAGENTISNDRSAYYKAVEEATKAAEEFSRARENNDISSMKKIMEDKRELLAMDKYANKLKKVIKLSRDMQDSVRLNEEIPIAEKRLKLKELEAQESKLYDKYLDVYKARVK